MYLYLSWFTETYNINQKLKVLSIQKFVYSINLQ